MTLKIKKMSADAKLPKRATEGSAGYDLSACVEQPLTIAAGGRALIPTGIAAALPENTVGLVFGRSGLGIKHGLAPSNAVGVIDSDYRGELRATLINHGSEPFKVCDGDRIAQLMFMPVMQAAFLPVDELDETERGTGGFGSTGVN